jgi:tRNA A-37 threonylcarbamoyl transferase component Bud32
MAVAEGHPSAEELAAFTLGTLDDDTDASIGDHVASCAPCQERAAVASDDPLVELLRRAHGQSAVLADTVTEAMQAHTPTPRLPEAVAVAPSPALPVGSDTANDLNAIPSELARHERYRVLRLLGQGGMGSVYEAEQIAMQRRVALKVIRRAYTANPAAVERFRREVRAAALLSHPNIVTAYAAETAGGLFLVMEYVEGITLGCLVKERGTLLIDEACDYIRQAALGLQHADERGLVHRDIKPDNLIRCSDGTVKILDFGLAALTTERGDGLTEANVVMGTPDYMAPEQAEDSHGADIRADLYSLGCTLYFLLTGKPPYPEPTALLKVLAHRNRPVPSLRQARPEVPPELATVVECLLAKKPEGRYQTPGEVAAALQPFTRSAARPRRNTQADNQSHLDAVRTGRGGWRRTVALVAVLAVLVTSLTGGAVWWRHRRAVLPEEVTTAVSEALPIKPGADQTAERWADPGLHVVQGLELWLDAARLNAARQAGDQAPLKAGDEVETWFDSSGKGRHVAQAVPAGRPRLVRVGEDWLVRFDGDDDHLRCTGLDRSLDTCTVFVVAAPQANPGGFCALLAANEAGRRDYETGFTLDLGLRPTARFDYLNFEGRGFGGPKNLLNTPIPFDTLHVLEAVMAPGKVQLFLDGKFSGERPFQPAPLRLDEITVGARYYTYGPGPQQVRGFLHGDIAEVLVYNRVLSDDETGAVRQYLDGKYARLRHDAVEPDGGFLKNQGFEAGRKGWEVTVFGARPTIATDADVAHEGKRFLRISAAQPSDTAVGQEVRLVPGRIYRLSGWVRTQGLDPRGSPVYGTLQVQREGGRGTLATGENHRGDNDWKKIVIQFEAPPSGVTRIVLFFVGWGQGTGTAWFDDIRLVEVTQPGR